jgi:carbonic anhydrase
MYTDIPSNAEAAGEDQQLPKWGYSKNEVWADESEKWGECRTGDAQSPVNVRPGYWAAFWGSAWARRYLRSKRAATGPLAWHIVSPAAQDQSREEHTFHRGIAYDGRSIVMPFKRLPSGIGLVTATGPDGGRYNLERVRVHTPSEHTFDGKHFAMEVQFEHVCIGAGRGGHGGPQHLVISLFLHQGNKSPEWIRTLSEAAQAAMSAHGSGSAGVEGLEVREVPFTRIAREVLMQTEMPLEMSHKLVHDDNSLHPKMAYRGRAGYALPGADVPNYKAYYLYHGSRTAPPCEQTFEWVLLKHSMAVREEDVFALTSLTGRNARATHKLNGRLVVDSTIHA